MGTYNYLIIPKWKVKILTKSDLICDWELESYTKIFNSEEVELDKEVLTKIEESNIIQTSIFLIASCSF